jgi:hypothetical protein
MRILLLTLSLTVFFVSLTFVRGIVLDAPNLTGNASNTERLQSDDFSSDQSEFYPLRSVQIQAQESQIKRAAHLVAAASPLSPPLTDQAGIKRGLASDPDEGDEESSVPVIKRGGVADPRDDSVGIDTYEGPAITKGEPEDPGEGTYYALENLEPIRLGDTSDPSEPNYYAPSFQRSVRLGEPASPND